MKKTMIAGAIVAAIMLVPEAVMAAVGSFSSSTSTTALTVTNSNSGKAISAKATTGVAGYFDRTGTGSSGYGLEAIARASKDGTSGVYGLAAGTSGITHGLYGRTLSNTDGANGVYGYAGGTGSVRGVQGDAPGTSGTGVIGIGGKNGVVGIGDSWGVGAQGRSVGVVAFSGTETPGDGSFGIATLTDTYAGGHLLGRGADLASTCDIAEGETSATCAYDDAFSDGVKPIVTATPLGDPGSFWFITDVTTAGFTLNLSRPAPTGGVNFNVISIGVAPF